MPIASGTRLGPYEILAPLGAGGMGEVYRARDTRLDRTVAVKILPEHLSSNPELKQRFEREAKAISSLQHPHICTLYDVGTQDGLDFLVMEYLEGETLERRVQRGALPGEQVLRYGVEICDALDKAHRRGIIHRDLKPGNIMLTKAGAKLLDFGLARLSAQPTPVAVALSEMVTEDRRITQEGMLLGTVQYMSPEQLEGKGGDARTDLFAFGLVLYEMATGRAAFTGKTKASLIASIMTSEPPAISQLQPMNPPALDRVVRRCLAKDPEERWQNAADLASELRWIAEGGSQVSLPAPVLARRKIRERVAWGVAVLAVVVALTLAVVMRRAPQHQEAFPTALRFEIPMKTEQYEAIYFPILSPDGSKIAFRGMDPSGAKTKIWVRWLSTGEARALPGTEGGGLPSWSPDGRFIAFAADGKLKKVDLEGSPPEVLCEGAVATLGWNREGTILFKRSFEGPLFRISEKGGEPTQVTRLDESRGEIGHYWAFHFLPDGQRFLYMAREKQGGGAIYLGDLKTQSSRLILPVKSHAEYALGYLLYVRDGALMAAPFDADKGELTGEPVRLRDRVSYEQGVGYAAFSVSENGLLVYNSGFSNQSQLTWLDRQGKVLGKIGEPGVFGPPRLSPRGDKLAVTRGDPARPLPADIWVFDLSRGGLENRITSDQTEHDIPTWSPTQDRIAFASERDGVWGLYVRNLSEDKEELVLRSTWKDLWVTDWSPDGRYLLFEAWETKESRDIYALDLLGERRPIPLVQGKTFDGWSAISPDGKWFAYTSEESGRLEIYVRPFLRPGEKLRVSPGGGQTPRWRRDGKELFYLSVAGTELLAVNFKAGPNPTVGSPRKLLEMNPGAGDYDISADGSRILVNPSGGLGPGAPTTVVVNWQAELKQATGDATRP